MFPGAHLTQTVVTVWSIVGVLAIIFCIVFVKLWRKAIDYIDKLDDVPARIDVNPPSGRYYDEHKRPYDWDHETKKGTYV